MRGFILISFGLALGVTPPAWAQQSDSPEHFSAADFQKHVEFLASDELAGRSPATPESAQAAQYVIEHLQQAGVSPLLKDGSWLQEFPLNKPDQNTGASFGKNVIGVRKGKGALADEAMIVSAHYDHLYPHSRPQPPDGDTIYNGADDNASGVAALLQIARALDAEADALGDNYRSVIFASFDGEEAGLLGAKHYVQRPLWPLDKTAAVINFDCIGRLRLGKVFVFDVETNPTLAEYAREAAAARQLTAETRLGSHGRSDHVEFLAQKIPSMHFFTGAHADYHKVTDEADRVNHEGGAAVAAIAYDVLRRAMTYPGAFDYKPLNPTYNIQLILKMMGSLGMVPKVAAQGGRYPEIAMVIPDSPAARHGMESGDKIAAINGFPLDRAEDALPLFQQANLAEGLRLTVLREDGEHEIELPAQVFDALNEPAK